MLSNCEIVGAVLIVLVIFWVVLFTIKASKLGLDEIREN